VYQNYIAMIFFKHANQSVELIDEFLNTIDQGALIFKEGVKNYLFGNRESFLDNLKTLSNLETEADITRRKIENILYTQSLMPQLRGDIMRLLEELDNIIDMAKKSLFQFDVEVPNIPPALNQDLIKLTELSCSAIESVVPAARAYFRSPENVKERIHRVYLFEREADKLADAIKRKVFQELPIARLSEKFHLRYFTLHIETLSDAAQETADLLSIMAIKRSI
jgi:predicted phosphate transport protein (TIGR00153 family)